MSVRSLTDRSAGADALRGSQSVRRALDLLSLVATQDRAGGVSLSEVVLISGLAKATGRRLLQELVHAGYAEQDAISHRYRLGPESYVVGSIAERRYGIHRLALDMLRRIVAKTEDTAFLSVRRGTYSVCLHREEATYPLRSHVLQAGDRHPLGVGAGSMSILAAMADNEIASAIAENRGVFAHRFPQYTPEVLWRDVTLTRQKGYAVNQGGVIAESWGIGAAVFGPHSEVVGALSVAAPKHRLASQRQHEVAELLIHEAKVLSNRLLAPARAATTEDLTRLKGTQ